MTSDVNDITLTVAEREQARQQTIKAMRVRLDQRKPMRTDDGTAGSKAARVTTSTLVWSRSFLPVIALLAALASSVRTIQTASEIYQSSGSHPIGVAVAAVAFTLSVEGALFVLALATEEAASGPNAAELVGEPAGPDRPAGTAAA